MALFTDEHFRLIPYIKTYKDRHGYGARFVCFGWGRWHIVLTFGA
jgi:hypothetical protein